MLNHLHIKLDSGSRDKLLLSYIYIYLHIYVYIHMVDPAQKKLN